ncbi:MAG: glycosyltransferase family 39 protein [Dysgonamonadaceae bacterium]|jgi:hypothetical protein|nr:glycosyltransferase family 39 protein [Dysgonamonadaceae bacterium]
MKRTNFIALTALLLAVCVPLLLPAVRESITSFVGEHIIRKTYRSDFWDIELMRFGITGLVFVVLGCFCFLFEKKLTFALTKKTYIGIETSLIAIFATACIGLILINQSVWFDEVWSLMMIRRSWTEMFDLLAEIDQHPPLYYILLKLTVALTGESFFAIKILSVVPSVLTLVAATVFLHRRFSPRTAVIFILCFIASDCLLHYSIEIRMYSWAFFFVTLLSISAYDFAKTGHNKWLVMFAAAAIGAAYTNLYAALAAGIIYAMSFLYIYVKQRRLIGKLLFIGFVCAATFLPQIFVIVEQLKNTVGSFWIEDSTNLRAFADYINIVFSNGNRITAFAWFLAFCGMVAHFARKKDKTFNDGYAFACLACVVLFLAFNLLVSVAIAPLFIGRYLLPVCPLVWLFLSIEAGRAGNKIAVMLLIGFLSIMAVGSFSTRFQGEYHENVDYQQFRSCIESELSDDDVFLFTDSHLTFSHISGVLSWLYPGHVHVFPDNNCNKFDKLLNRKSIGLTRFQAGTQFTAHPVWLFTGASEDANATIAKIEDTNGKSRNCGDFGWNIYRFRVFRYKSTNILPM